MVMIIGVVVMVMSLCSGGANTSLIPWINETLLSYPRQLDYLDSMERNLPIGSRSIYFRPRELLESGKLKTLSAGSSSVGSPLPGSYLLSLARGPPAPGVGAEVSPTKEPEGPHFMSTGGRRNVTTTVGQTAYLHCFVAKLGDEAQVSWIRKRDLHVLSSGVIVFASDQRFQVLHIAESEKWTLQIKFAQLRDAGIYECQVNTEPKISMSYFLSVVESQARILGPEYVKAGSAINLTCVINQPHMQSLVHWYHNKGILEYEGSVSIHTRGDGQQTTSHLTITKATTKHSGNYTCWPTSAQSASVIVNVVLEGEQPAAMQTGGALETPISSVGREHFLLLLLLLQAILQMLLNQEALHLTYPLIRR